MKALTQGRRGVMLGSSGISSVLVILAVTCQSLSFYQATRWLNFMTKGFITILNLTALTYKTEVLPTTVRAQGMAFSTAIANITASMVGYLHLLSKFSNLEYFNRYQFCEQMWEPTLSSICDYVC